MNGTTVLIIALIGAVWLLVITIMLLKMVTRYNRLTKGIRKKELRELLEHVNRKLIKQQQSLDNIEGWIKRIEINGKSHIQKVGFIRFNPFTDTGGNQSFCLSILDGDENGIVLSSLHSREQTRIYAKAITKGKTEGLELSNEEKRSIEQAKASKK